jgi:hypothetical protein
MMRKKRLILSLLIVEIVLLLAMIWMSVK